MSINIKKFINDISWPGVDSPKPTIIVYTLYYDVDGAPEIDIDKNDLEIRSSFSTVLFDEFNQYSLNIKVFDISIYGKSNSFEIYEKLIIKLLSSTIKHGSRFSWCMFEGGFMDIEKLFNEWESESTYAYCLPGEQPEIAIDEETRKSLQWKRKLNDLSHLFKK